MIIAKIVDLPRDDQGMIQLLFGVDFPLRGDVHVLGAAEHLRNWTMVLAITLVSVKGERKPE